MNRRTLGLLLAVYGIIGGLFGTFISYFVYYSFGSWQALFGVFNPLVFMLPYSIFNDLVMGTYPFAMIALGLYLILTYKKKPRR